MNKTFVSDRIARQKVNKASPQTWSSLNSYLSIGHRMKGKETATATVMVSLSLPT